MRLYYLLDRPADALRQFAVCREVLQPELALEPKAETQALAPLATAEAFCRERAAKDGRLRLGHA